MFKPLKTSGFLVKVFGVDGVIKEEPVDTGLAMEAAACLGKDVPKNLQFSKIFQSYNKHYVGFPNGVIEACKYEQLPQKVTLREEKGRAVVTELRKTTDRVRFGSKGLNEFWKVTKVKIGDKMDFELILGEGRKIKEIRLKITPRKKKAN